ncbi:hypothetical protein IW261DRAFT_1559005 [Armillaria novae-zelandiae]|uniref:Uncharacterized protein n=1 Tax=Armillaria novae-zelandiae TaxID=153914 RepID=A0AA39UQ35_9AGAR|nr:hypothetical protein IW261DRAFT_1559005 [Armillaria novae-zelandiae]
MPGQHAMAEEILHEVEGNPVKIDVSLMVHNKHQQSLHFELAEQSVSRTATTIDNSESMLHYHTIDPLPTSSSIQESLQTTNIVDVQQLPSRSSSRQPPPAQSMVNTKTPTFTTNMEDMLATCTSLSATGNLPLKETTVATNNDAISLQPVEPTSL